VTHVVTWGCGNHKTISSAAELDTVLDEIDAAGLPQLVGIYPPEYTTADFDPWSDAARPPALQLGVGHPDRSFLLFIGDGGGEAIEAGMPPWPDDAADIAFDYGGEPVFCGADRARVRPQTARQAAREFVATGQRPTCVTWQR
jgi:hypothetical protein